MDSNCGLFFDGLVSGKPQVTPVEPVYPRNENRFYGNGCAMVKSKSQQDGSQKSYNFAENMTWPSLGLSQATLNTVHSVGLFFPNFAQRSAIPLVLSGKDAHFVYTGVGRSLAYLLPLLEMSQQATGSSSLVITQDASSARRCLEKLVFLVKELKPKPDCFAILSEKDANSFKAITEPAIVITTFGCFKTLLLQMATSLPACIVVDHIDNEKHVSNHIHDAYRADNEGSQMIWFSRDEETSLNGKIPLNAASLLPKNKEQPTNLSHECVSISSNVKTKLAMLLALVKLESDAAIILFTNHSSALHRIKHLLCDAGRKALVIENSMTEQDVRSVLASIKRAECDTVIIKDQIIDGEKFAFPGARVTLIHYDAPPSVASFIEKASVISHCAGKRKIVSFLDASQEPLLHTFRLITVSENDRCRVLQTAKRDFGDRIVQEAREFIEDKMTDIRKLLELERKQRASLKKEFSPQPRAKREISETERAATESKRTPRENPRKKARNDPKEKVVKHEKNSHGERLAQKRKLIKKAKNVHDLKGLLPKGKFRKIRKRHERIERQKNPNMRSKKVKGGKSKGSKRR